MVLSEKATAKIVQENHYYPFGLNMVGIEKLGKPDDKFQYNKKEKEQSLELSLNDFHARLQDPQLLRFWQTDPHVVKYLAWSPYNHVYNNPLKFIDPDGKDGIAVIDREKGTIVIKSIFYYSKENGEDRLKSFGLDINHIKTDFQSFWGNNGKLHSIDIDGKTWTVSYTLDIQEFDTNQERDAAFAKDGTGNLLNIKGQDEGGSNWSDANRQLNYSPSQQREGSFSHEYAHSIGIFGHNPRHGTDENNEKTSGGVSSYAYFRTLENPEKENSIRDLINLGASQTQTNIHVTGVGVKYTKDATGNNILDHKGVKIQEADKKRPHKVIER